MLGKHSLSKSLPFQLVMIKVISGILSVERLESQHRELEKLHAADDVAQIRLDRLRSDLENFRGEYLSSHNNAHKYVPPPKYD